MLRQNGISPAVGVEVFWQRGPFDIEYLGADVSAQNHLTEKFSLRGNLSFAMDTELHGGLRLDYQTTNKLGVFAEYAGFFKNADFFQLGDTPDYFDASNFTSGITFLATQNWMFDLSGS